MLKTLCCLIGIALLAAGLAFVGCSVDPEEASTTNVHGIDVKNFDTTCHPCEDFFQYANGSWLENNPIPDEYSGWGISYEIFERNNEILKEILETTAAQQVEKGTDAQKVGDFYKSAMDTTAIEAAGLQPLRNDFAKIDAISGLNDLRTAITDYQLEGVPVLFATDAYEDLENSSRVIFYAEQGGLGLPERDYYTRDDEESVTLRSQYVDHIAAMFVLSGKDSADARIAADAVMAIETRLAKVSLTAVQLRDPTTWYDIKTLRQATEVTPDFPWSDYFQGVGVTGIEEFSIAPDKFFTEVNLMLTETPLDDWKGYLLWKVLSNYAYNLNSDLVNEKFRFYGEILTGKQELEPRWKRALRSVNSNLGEALGQLYVEKAFPPESKARALEMVGNLRLAVQERLSNLEWLTEPTRQQALAKLATFKTKIGYPDSWRDYSALEIVPGPWVENVRRGSAFDVRRRLNKIGQPVDRNEWYMNPQTVNAYYNPLMNEIVFPAGILQPPFFDGEIDDPINYGAMGAVIGHEMLHGYDDQGKRFDADGNMKNWWTDEDVDRFNERTKPLVEQFNAYVAVDSLHVNGELTLGENIADLGGLRVSLAALQISLEGKEETLIDGFTPRQRFFLSFAQAWRGHFRDELTKIIVNTDPHSPNKFRVIGPLSNMDEFFAAFGCKEGDKMVRPEDQRIRIW